MTATFQKYKITVLTLRVNEVKVTSRNAFLDHFFALEIEKDSKYDQRTLLQGYPRILNLSFNPEAANTTHMLLYELF